MNNDLEMNAFVKKCSDKPLELYFQMMLNIGQLL